MSTFGKIYMVMKMFEPLAIKMRPVFLDDVIGQSHLIGENGIINNLIKNKKLFSMILYGKPGIGKTTIASVIVKELSLKHRFLNAVINNKKDFDIVIEEAKLYNGMVVIMDEIHRLNKDKQDLLLPYLESGLITLIALTTSNPYHSINPAIRSRCHIFELKELTDEDITKSIKQVVHKKVLPDLKISNSVINYIAKISNGDLRYAYSLLELAYYGISEHNITLEKITELANKPSFFHDANESGHYDTLSALQKSIRGSDVDASLHYLGRLLFVGDLESIFRRLTVIAYEDIGLSNPMIGVKLDSAINASLRVGLPEARIILSSIVIEMALSPKSNSAYLAIQNVLNDLNSGLSGSIPDHIKTNSKSYKYPHDYKNSFVKQQYLPDELKNKKYFEVKNNNRYELQLKEIYDKIKSVN